MSNENEKAVISGKDKYPNEEYIIEHYHGFRVG